MLRLAAEVQQLRADLAAQSERARLLSGKMIDSEMTQDDMVASLNRLERAAKDAAPITESSKARLDQLASELEKRGKRGQKGVTYAEAGKILGLSKSMICRLRGQIGSDPRFNIRWHPVKKNKKIISLKKLR